MRRELSAAALGLTFALLANISLTVIRTAWHVEEYALTANRKAVELLPPLTQPLLMAGVVLAAALCLGFITYKVAKIKL